MFCVSNQLFFLPCLNILQIIVNFWVFISSIKQCASSAPPLFRSKLIISTRIKSDKDTQTFTIRINRVVRFLQTVHDSPHIAKSTLRKIVGKVGFADTSNSKKKITNIISQLTKVGTRPLHQNTHKNNSYYK